MSIGWGVGIAKWDEDRESLPEGAVAVVEVPPNPPDPFPLDVGADSNILVLNMALKIRPYFK